MSNLCRPSIVSDIDSSKSRVFTRDEEEKGEDQNDRVTESA